MWLKHNNIFQGLNIMKFLFILKTCKLFATEKKEALTNLKHGSVVYYPNVLSVIS